jgi:hypothetical protein
MKKVERKLNATNALILAVLLRDGLKFFFLFFKNKSAFGDKNKKKNLPRIRQELFTFKEEKSVMRKWGNHALK